MSRVSFSLFHHSVVILLDCFSVMIRVHFISYDASMRAEIFLNFNNTYSRAKIWYQ